MCPISSRLYGYDYKAKRILDKFIAHCANSKGDLHISYQDEHLKSVAAMVLTLQTIQYFVRKIEKDFDIEFVLEEFSYDKQKTFGKYAIFANLLNSTIRDEYLESKALSWVNHMDYSYGIFGELLDVESKAAGSLTHWRVLNFECCGKRLSIYPDGGLLNGWYLDDAHTTQYYDLDTTLHDDDIPMVRKQAIKYEIHLEDIKQNYL